MELEQSLEKEMEEEAALVQFKCKCGIRPLPIISKPADMAIERRVEPWGTEPHQPSSCPMFASSCGRKLATMVVALRRGVWHAQLLGAEKYLKSCFSSTIAVLISGSLAFCIKLVVYS